MPPRISKAERGGRGSHRLSLVDPPEGKRAERSTGNRAEQRAGGLRGISAPWRSLNVGSLFTGVAGIDLALEAFGHKVIWQAEMDPAARRVLAEKFPSVHCYRDVKEIDATAPKIDILCGGFPCQDVSVAGAGAGIEGDRSGLWSEFARIIRALQPRFVFIENVAALASRGLDRVLRDLAEIGFDAEWDCFTAAEVGAPHRRERIFILAWSVSVGQADADRVALRQLTERDQRRGRSERTAERGDAVALDDRGPVADANGGRREGVRFLEPDGLGSARGREPHGRSGARRLDHVFPPGPDRIGEWPGPQPAVRRGDAGIPVGMDRGWRAKNRTTDRLRLLGNACCPQQAALALELLAARASAEVAAA